MKKALISPLEASQTGYRVVQVEQQEFDVAAPLFWVDCADDITAENYYYDPADEQIKTIEKTVPELSGDHVEDMITLLLNS